VARRYHWALKLSAVLVSIGVALAFAELALRQSRKLSPLKLHVWDFSLNACKRCGECPEIFRNAANVNTYGLRDHDYAIPKAAGTKRILVLGDSVAYGFGLPADQAFPQQLDKLLDARVEVINAGVPGYSPYNERKLYDSVGAAYQPDLVLVQLCMNDVADPLIHWRILTDEVKVPDEAIPNPRYHQEHVLPLVEGYRTYRSYEGWRNGTPLVKLQLFELIEHSAVSRLWIPSVVQDVTVRRTRQVDGRRWPIHVTMEDSMTIDPLMDYESTEWKWLRSQLDQLRGAVEARYAKLALVVAPLSFQVAEGYPYLPQRLFERYCRENSLPCLDLLAPFRRHQGEEMFFLPKDFDFDKPSTAWDRHYRDIWHFSAAGNRVAAAALKEFIEENRLLP